MDDEESFADHGVEDGARLEVVTESIPELLEAMGFPPEHLDLLTEFYSKPECDQDKILPITWDAHEAHWTTRVQGLSELMLKHDRRESAGLVQWVRWAFRCP